jgi:putative tryptophan/tyrosine transport system substrate-binding protein
MRRREFIRLFSSSVLAWPLTARAQQAAMPIVAYLSVGSPDAIAGRLNAFHKGLGEMGYAEGRNVQVEYHWFEGQYQHLAAVLGDLIQRQVAVMAIPGSTPISLAAKSATNTIPIVFGVAEDPVTLGLVFSIKPAPLVRSTGPSPLWRAITLMPSLLEARHCSLAEACRLPRWRYATDYPQVIPHANWFRPDC